MRIHRTLPVRTEGSDKVRYEECVIWIDETPPEYRRGKNRKMKSRKYKREKQERFHERH